MDFLCITNKKFLHHIVRQTFDGGAVITEEPEESSRRIHFGHNDEEKFVVTEIGWKFLVYDYRVGIHNVLYLRLHQTFETKR